MAEYVALAGARGSSREDALDFIEQVLDDDEIELIWVDEDLHRKAVQLLVSRHDKTYSLCDAVAFVIMRDLDIARALTTDRHFLNRKVLSGCSNPNSDTKMTSMGFIEMIDCDGFEAVERENSF